MVLHNASTLSTNFLPEQRRKQKKEKRFRFDENENWKFSKISRDKMQPLFKLRLMFVYQFSPSNLLTQRERLTMVYVKA